MCKEIEFKISRKCISYWRDKKFVDDCSGNVLGMDCFERQRREWGKLTSMPPGWYLDFSMFYEKCIILTEKVKIME
jgi:hypothetical protein